MTLFTVVPLLIVVYYAFTDGNGAFTMENLASISGYGSVFARSLLLALIATVICLVLAVPTRLFSRPPCGSNNARHNLCSSRGDASPTSWSCNFFVRFAPPLRSGVRAVDSGRFGTGVPV